MLKSSFSCYRASSQNIVCANISRFMCKVQLWLDKRRAYSRLVDKIQYSSLMYNNYYSIEVVIFIR